MHHLAANWIPPNERSKFVTAYMGMLNKRSILRIFFPYFIRKYRLTVSSCPSICLSSPESFKLKKKFNRTLYEHHATTGHPTFVLFNMLTSVIPI